ncbi:MAG TPA: TrkA C-terminal domain-containing protein [Geminicoccaceae bacterium]|nr:TrkA C-terminal domain-containing protein [Geminicoccus sp.]HMU52803.1 TrkA C-terminal domain-containing protein [Geminicoccaceae bacterium]
MTALMGLLEQQPLLTLFLVIGLGYAIGEVSLRGFSLGVGAVLFVGLAIGAMAPKAAPPAIVGSLGLVMFLYGIGVQYGRQFFAGLTSASGLRANIPAVVGLAAGVLVTALVIELGVPLAYAIGLFAGAMTSTAALQAGLQAVGNLDPAIGYGVAYPFGVVGPILCMYFWNAFFRPAIPAPASVGLMFREVAITNPTVVGRRVSEAAAMLPEGTVFWVIRQAHHNLHPSPDLVLGEGSVALLGSDSEAALAKAVELLGSAVTGRIVADRSDLDHVRIFVSHHGVCGKKLGELRMPEGVDAFVSDVRRGDVELLPRPDLVLEQGDRVGVLAHRRHFPALRRFFGGSMKGTTELSYVSIGIGMVLGVALGLVPIPVPGLGTLSLGLAGGPLVVALILGRLGRTGSLVWTMPLSANLTLRNFGLTIFLAQVGLTSGPGFVSTVQQTGLTLLLLGAAILLAVVLTVLAIGHLILRIPFDELLGITAGATGNPAILAYAGRTTATDKPDIGYAIIFPGMTILKILVVQGVVALWGV